MWGIGTVFHENLTVQEDSLSVANFDEYKWASYKEAPNMKIELIGQDFPPSGAGETAIVSAVASLTNAIYAMTGKPVLNLPLQQQKG